MPASTHNFADWLFPKYCDLCRRLITDDAAPGVCSECAAGLALNTSPCTVCGVPETGAETCGQCQLETSRGNRFLDQTIAPFLYEKGVADLIQRFKYNRKLYLARTFADLLLDAIDANEFAGATLLPVPLHKKRLRSRGYNQALELAKVLAGGLNAGLPDNAVQRTRATETQTGLPFAQRATNVKNAFSVTEKFKENHLLNDVLLIDDVMTTGSTIKEIARVLKLNGAARVRALVIARA